MLAAASVLPKWSQCSVTIRIGTALLCMNLHCTALKCIHLHCRDAKIYDLANNDHVSCVEKVRSVAIAHFLVAFFGTFGHFM